MLRKIGRAGAGLWLFLLVFAVVTLSRQAAWSSAVSVASWQYSATPVVKLGIRNKEGRGLDKFTAVCVVSAPDNKQYKAQANLVGDNWG